MNDIVGWWFTRCKKGRILFVCPLLFWPSLQNGESVSVARLDSSGRALWCLIDTRREEGKGKYSRSQILDLIREGTLVVESIWLLSHSHKPMGSLGSITGLTTRASGIVLRVQPMCVRPKQAPVRWATHGVRPTHYIVGLGPLQTLRVFIAANAGIAKILCLWGCFGYKTSLKIRNKQWTGQIIKMTIYWKWK